MSPLRVVVASSNNALTLPSPSTRFFLASRTTNLDKHSVTPSVPAHSSSPLPSPLDRHLSPRTAPLSLLNPPISPSSLQMTPTLPPSPLRFLATFLFAFVSIALLLPTATASALTTTINANERTCFYALVDKAGEKVRPLQPSREEGPPRGPLKREGEGPNKHVERGGGQASGPRRAFRCR